MDRLTGALIKAILAIVLWVASLTRRIVFYDWKLGLILFIFGWSYSISITLKKDNWKE